MKNRRKYAALLAVLLLVTVLLCACGSKKCSICGKTITGSGHSTSAGLVCDDCYYGTNLGASTTRSTGTGVWIAITVMVFVAVFAATSGVVYLVLQRVLPQEEEAPVRPAPAEYPRRAPQSAAQRPAAPRPAARPVANVPRPAAQPTAQRPAAPAAPRPAASAARPASPRAYTGEWVCPRDHSRNGGPYCTLCGCPRPQAPKPAANRQPEIQQPVRPVQPVHPVQPAAQPSQPVRSAYTRPEEEDFSAYFQDQAASQPAPVIPEEQEAAPAYTGKFARKQEAPPATPEPQPEADYDAELLAAIFREAEQGPDDSQ